MTDPRKPGRSKLTWSPNDIIKARRETFAEKYADAMAPRPAPNVEAEADEDPGPFEPVHDAAPEAEFAPEPEQLELPFEFPDVKMTPPSPRPDTSDQIAELLVFVKGMVAKQVEQDKRLNQLAKRSVGRPERPAARPSARAKGEDVVTDRHGNIVTRRAQRSIDPFELPEEFMIAQRSDDYTAEWKSFRVMNMDMDAYVNDLYNDGWSPVKNSRIPGRYGGEPEEPVTHQGMMLMERPAGLTRLARREQELASREQVNSRKRDWGVDERRKRVFDPEGRFSENLNRIRSTVEQAPSHSYPDLEIATSDEL